MLATLPMAGPVSADAANALPRWQQLRYNAERGS